ncbi:gluconate 2-dehydrogenase subunit 3 family protein [Olivibacter sitiensis]|uniref:gluconate 2-dehydrogenase subunit 3 family protein n=1 Tax=Olivibacter sitiensis TaxID=376470 RepID=UPI000482C8D2|nr:gluconate 2-dehydrogenase subunit 3 family protein [Olivibacter sitiensis]
MNRREALNRVAWLMGGAVIGANLFLEGCTKKASKEVESLFEPDRIDFLGDIAETILPQTKTPGAKEAGVGEFIPIMVRDCYTEADQKVFMEGLIDVDERAKKDFDAPFQELTAEQRTALLNTLDKESKEYNANKKEEEPKHYFSMIKELTLLGFFTSEQGATIAMRYVLIPGKYDGNVPYKKGDKAWAT